MRDDGDVRPSPGGRRGEIDSKAGCDVAGLSPILQASASLQPEACDVFNWIYHLPLWLLAVLFVAFFLGLTWIGMIVTRPRVHRWVGSDEGWNDLMGHFIASHGVLFGILLALLALGAVENRTRLL